MSYAANANRPNPAAMIGALGVPGMFAALLVVGLAVKITVAPPPVIIDTWNVEPEIPDIPPEPVEQTSSNSSEQTTQVPDIPTTRPDSEFEFDFTNTGAVEELPGLGDELIGAGPVDFGIPEIAPIPSIDPIAASPRGNPGNWITDNDYRTSWINRGYAGRANFMLEIDARGRVTDCRITGSTGHAALDEATCRLLERRARFDPAKDSSGNATSGTYRNAVTWEIPE